jgi:hypothetical protein
MEGRGLCRAYRLVHQQLVRRYGKSRCVSIAPEFSEILITLFIQTRAADLAKQAKAVGLQAKACPSSSITRLGQR